MVFSLVFGYSSAAFASPLPLTEETLPQLVAYEDMPEAYKAILDPDAVIYQNADGTYDIYQSRSVTASTTLSVQDNPNSFYAPNGGSYSDIANGQITIFDFIVYQTYINEEDTEDIYIELDPTVSDLIGDYLQATTTPLFAVQVEEIKQMLLQTLGLAFTYAAIAAYINKTFEFVYGLNKNQLLTASGYLENGVLIEYMTSAGNGNSRIYSPWSNDCYVPMFPYGGTATWHEGDLWVMPGSTGIN